MRDGNIRRIANSSQAFPSVSIENQVRIAGWSLNDFSEDFSEGWQHSNPEESLQGIGKKIITLTNVVGTLEVEI